MDGDNEMVGAAWRPEATCLRMHWQIPVTWRW
jgi:hypothetical protein